MAEEEKSPADDISRLTRDFLKIAEQNQRAFLDAFKSVQVPVATAMDPLNSGGAFAEAAKLLANDPGKIMEANLELWREHMKLWSYAADKLSGKEAAPAAEPERGDRRFRDREWGENEVYDFIKQSYLITSRWLINTLSGIEGLSEHDAKKVTFHTQQLADALSPSNFPLTNPEVMRATTESGGDNLVKGLENLRRDLEAGGGELRITMTDPDAFEVGRNLATARGTVVYRNDLVELIQYAPTTDEVFTRPLVIVPPWINKYYILDLRPDNSFIRWSVDHGYTVFVCSWVNPGSALAEKTFADYMQEGILDVLNAVELAVGEREVSMIGYCIGGTLLGATLAYMAAVGDNRVKAATFFAAQMDFSEPGDLGVFIDEQQIEELDRKMADTGFLDGKEMSTTFNMLRANDLIWSFYVTNYLLGKNPMQFDLLYWNGDTTRMSRTNFLYYLRQMYMSNRLAEPGGLTLKGVPIDLAAVDIPIYLQASKEDHIAPCNSVFKAVNLFSGPVRFILAGSGHIAGVINPPAAKKYNYWMNELQPKVLETWLSGADEHPGSWWPDWHRWLSQHAGDRVEARDPGRGGLPALGDAPGDYVKVK